MGIFDFFRSTPKASAEDPVAPFLEGALSLDLTDPRLAAFLRGFGISDSGVRITVEQAMRNPAVFRCVSLISNSIGMLPLHLVNRETKKKARDNPLFPILHRRPNAWQTAYDFRTLLQMRALTQGDGYARIVWSPDVRGGGRKVLALVPLDTDRVTPVQNADWTVSYRYQPSSGGEVRLAPTDVFHLRGMSKDGIRGIRLVEQAADAIGLAIAAQLALSRLFKNGSFVNGYLSHPKNLSADAIARLREHWNANFTSADNAGRTPVFEEGLEYKLLGSTAKDAQSNETRARQVEEIARIFGVPRPLLMIDETSWGSGIDALGQFFVRYGLNPWFEAWQQAVERSLLSDADAETLEAKFNAGALLRGSMKDQGDFFSQALGAGGHQPWMTANEVRDVLDMPRHDDGDALANPMMGHNGGPPIDGA